MDPPPPPPAARVQLPGEGTRRQDVYRPSSPPQGNTLKRKRPESRNCQGGPMGQKITSCFMGLKSVKEQNVLQNNEE